MSVDAFQYDRRLPAGYIRLFRVLPESDSIELELVDFVLLAADRPIYAGLSYVCGDPTPTNAVICNGKSLQLTKNLYQALRNLKATKVRAWIWADAICMNQTDDVEKGEQVQNMGNIYHYAATVVIWLGEEDAQTGKAYECLEILNDRVWPGLEDLEKWKPLGRSQSRKDRVGRNAKEICAHYGIPPSSDDMFVALRELIERPWFDRAWTFQESRLAVLRTFRCGSHETGGISVERAATILGKLKNCTDDPAYSIFQPSRKLGQISNGYYRDYGGNPIWDSLLGLLTSRRASKCSNEKDLVYSLLGAAVESYGIAPDYSDNVSGESVYITTAWQVVSASATLSILCVACHDDESTLPTWVPDWRHSNNGVFSIDDPYCSTRTSFPVARLSECGTELCLQGLRVDKVRDVHWGLPPSEWFDPDRPYQYTDEVVSDVLKFRISSADLTHWGDYDTRRWTAESLEEVEHTFKHALDDEGVQSRRVYLFDSLHTSVGRQLTFITQKGWLGMANPKAKSGDTIVLLLGSDHPVMLRRKGEKYTLVDVCYVHGLMDGEGLVEARRKSQPEYNHEDTSWLQRLHEEPLPFETSEFVLV